MRSASYIAAMLLASGAAHAGGIGRSGQSIAPIFETGNHAELSFGSILPSVHGNFSTVLGASSSGNVISDYFQWEAAIKMDLSRRASVALILDQPFGAQVAYESGLYPLANTNASFESHAVTALGRYEFENGLSIHGGISAVRAQADVTLSFGGATAYKADFSAETGFGYVLGAAYERPEIALRAALTYRSAINMSHDAELSTPVGQISMPSSTDYSFPQSVNLDFQTGIMAGTLLLASARWVDWSSLEIGGPNPARPSSPVDLVDYEDDSITYSVGIGRQITDSLSGSFTVGWEKSTGKDVSNLSPTDGMRRATLGLQYQLPNKSTVSAAYSYVEFGDALTENLRSEFDGNDASAFGLKYAAKF